MDVRERVQVARRIDLRASALKAQAWLTTPIPAERRVPELTDKAAALQRVLKEPILAYVDVARQTRLLDEIVFGVHAPDPSGHREAFLYNVLRRSVGIFIPSEEGEQIGRAYGALQRAVGSRAHMYLGARYVSSKEIEGLLELATTRGATYDRIQLHPRPLPYRRRR